MTEKLLIVGGTGFIGTHLTKEALIRKFQVSILSKKNVPISQKIDCVEYLSADVSVKSELLNQLNLRTFDHVINLSGYIDHSVYSKGGNTVIDVHFNGTKNLVDCLNHSDLRNFIQIGSSEEYGNNIAPQDESLKEHFISPYSFAKAASTHFLQMLYMTESFPSIILRPFLLYGPGQSKERFIPQVMKGCIGGKKFPISKGKQLRDFCFISDFVEAVFASLDNISAYGEVINIASGKPISIEDMVKKIKDLVGFGKPEFGSLKYRSGENMALYANISKANKLLNWCPVIELNEGLLETINWVKERD